MQVQQGAITVEAAGQPARFSLAVFEPGVGLGSRPEAAHA